MSYQDTETAHNDKRYRAKHQHNAFKGNSCIQLHQINERVEETVKKEIHAVVGTKSVKDR